MNNSNVKLGSAFALVAVLANVFSMAITPALGAMNDPEFDLALQWGYETGLTRYDTEDAFMPMGTLTREQGAKFLSAFGSEILGVEADASINCTFSDADQMDPTLVSSVALACGQGMLKGSDNMFMPTAAMTKGQFVTAIVRGLDGFMDENVSPWYKNYCDWAQDQGIIKPTDCITLDKPVTRYEALLILYRGRVVGDDSIITDPTDPVVVVAGGEVSLNIADNTPGVQYVPGTGSNIKVLKFDVTAGENAVGITSLNFKLAGLVNRANVNVSITDEDGIRLSTERSFNTNFEALVTANTSAGIKVPANSTRSFYAVVSTNGSVNERFVISIDGASSVSSTATVGGTFPIVSNQVNTTEYSSQSIKFDGELTGAVISSNDKLYVGNTAKQLGKFSLDSQGGSRDVTVKSIRFRSTDAVAGVISNLTLEVDGVNIAKSVIVDGKFVTFIVNDYVIPYGNSKQFYIKGDIIGGEANDNVQFYLDASSDIVALENGTNASASVVFNLVKKDYLKAYTIVEGDNFISRTDSLISNMNVPTDANKVLALKANINTTSEMSVDKIRVNYSGTGIVSAIEYVTLYVNGLLVDEITSGLSNTGGVLEFSFYGNLKAGSNTVEVRMDTLQNASNDSRIKFTIDAASIAYSSNAEYTSTSNSVLSADVSGTANGVTLLIKTAGVERISNTYETALQTAVVEGEINAIKFAVQASNVRDIVVRGFSTNISGSNSNGGIQDATLYVAGVTGFVEVESFSKGQSVSFNGLNVTIPAGSSKEFLVVTKTTSTLATGNNGLQFSVSNFDIEDSEGNSTTIPAIYQTVKGNFIDVKGALDVYGSRTLASSSTIITASSTDSVTIGTFELKSNYIDALVQEIALVNLTDAFTGGAVNSATVSGKIQTSTNGAVVELYQGTTKVGEQQLLNGVAYVKIANPVTIKAGTATVFTVKIRGNNAIAYLSDSNKQLRLAVLEGTLGDGTTQTLISADGGSISNVTNIFTDLVFKKHVLRASTLVFANQTMPGSTTNNLYDIAKNARATLFKTTITAKGTKSVNVHELTFDNIFTGINVSAYQLKVDGDELTTDATCAYGADKVVCTLTGTYLNGLSITAGSTRNIELTALVSPITATSTNPAYVSTSMSEGTATNFTGYTASDAATTAASVVWSDNSDPTLTLGSINWFTDAGVEELPTNSWTFSRN